jgi:hypothetical protein
MWQGLITTTSRHLRHAQLKASTCICLSHLCAHHWLGGRAVTFVVVVVAVAVAALKAARCDQVQSYARMSECGDIKLTAAASRCRACRSLKRLILYLPSHRYVIGP